MLLNIPEIDALHVWRDVRRDGGEVAERAVHLGGDVAGAEPGTGDGSRGDSQAEGQEGPQAARWAPARPRHPAGTATLPSAQRRPAASCRENTTQAFRVTSLLSCSVLSYKHKKNFLT